MGQGGHAGEQGAAPGTGEVAWPRRHRSALPHALRRSVRQRRGAGLVPDAVEDRARGAQLLRRARLRRGRDADPAAAVRRRRGAAVHDAPQRTRHAAVPADRAGALPQAAHRRRHGAGLRGRPRVPQRRHQHAPQSRVHDARELRGVGRLPRHHGARRGPVRAPLRTRARRRFEGDVPRTGVRPRAAVREGALPRPVRGEEPRRRLVRRCPGAAARQGTRAGGGWHRAGEAGQRLVRGDGRGHADRPGVRARLPDRDQPAGEAPGRGPARHRALRTVRRRHGARQRVQRTQRPDRPGAAPRRAGLRQVLLRRRRDAG